VAALALAVVALVGCGRRGSPAGKGDVPAVRPADSVGVDGPAGAGPVRPPEAGKPVRIGAGEREGVWLCVERSGAVATNEDVTLGFDEQARLGLVVRSGDAWYSDFPAALVDGRTVRAPAPLAELPGLVRVAWQLVESAESSWRNRDRNPGWWAAMRYEERELPWDGLGVVEAEVRSARLRGVRWGGKGVGTMRVKAVVELESAVLATPGAESVGQGGVPDGVRRITRLGGSGNAVVDAALGLSGLPYIWGSAPVGGEGDWSSHQAELFVGADCADLVVAAWRLSGLAGESYTSAARLLDRHAASSIRIADRRSGIYIGVDGAPIPFGRGGVEAGAMIAWRFGVNLGKSHAAVLVEDRGPTGAPNGVLDEWDLVLHALWEPPVLEPLSGVLAVVPVAVVPRPAGG
jgi:cell wall-associated NlpC family hydrolase